GAAGFRPPHREPERLCAVPAGGRGPHRRVPDLRLLRGGGGVRAGPGAGPGRRPGQGLCGCDRHPGGPRPLPRLPGRVRRQIYLNCDGVLADFDTAAEAILGIHPRTFEDQHGAAEFWTRLARAPDFFGRLEPMPDAYDLYDAVKAKAPIILTGMPEG